MHTSIETSCNSLEHGFAKRFFAGALFAAAPLLLVMPHATLSAQDAPQVAPSRTFQQQVDDQSTGVLPRGMSVNGQSREFDNGDSTNGASYNDGQQQPPSRLQIEDRSQPQPPNNMRPTLPRQPQNRQSQEQQPATPQFTRSREDQLQQSNTMVDPDRQSHAGAPAAISQGYAQRYDRQIDNASYQEPLTSQQSPNQVRPVAFQQPSGQSGRAVATNGQASAYQGKSSLAKTIIEDALSPAVENLLPGRKFTLEEAIKRKGDRNSRLQLVKDYWKLTVALADFQFANEEVDYISRITPPKVSEARALWQSEVAAAEARVAEAKLLAMDAQETLRQKLALTADDLPVATDTPWVGRYRTNYEQHVSAGMATENLKRIDRILPVMWQLVQRRASSVESSRIAFNELSRVYQTGGLPIGEILSMHRRLRDQRIAFLAAVRDYNFSIADYAMSTANANGQSNVVTAMLLYDETIGLDQIQNRAIRQASAAADPAYRGNTAVSETNSQGSVQPAFNGQSGNSAQPAQNGNGFSVNGSATGQPPQSGFRPDTQPRAQSGAQPRAQASAFQGSGGGSFGQ